MQNSYSSEKIKIEFEGWHCIPKREEKKILIEARQRFKNANFIDNCGILVETVQPDKALLFCLEILERYKNCINAWDGYTIKKVSKRAIYNYQDKKRKLLFSYFKKLIIENQFDDIKTVLAGILYLSPDEISFIISSIEKDLNKLMVLMNDEELKLAYNQLLKYASFIIRQINNGAE